MKKFPPQACVSHQSDERDGAGWVSRRSARRTWTDWRRARVRSASPSDRPTGRLHSVRIAALPGSSDAWRFVPFAPRRAPTAPRPHAGMLADKSSELLLLLLLFFLSLLLSSSWRFYSGESSLLSTFYDPPGQRRRPGRIHEIYVVMDIIRICTFCGNITRLMRSQDAGCRFTREDGLRFKMDCR